MSGRDFTRSGDSSQGTFVRQAVGAMTVDTVTKLGLIFFLYQYMGKPIRQHAKGLCMWAWIEKQKAVAEDGIGQMRR